MDATIIIDRVLKAVGLNAPTFAKTIGVNYQRIFDLQRGRVKKFHPEIVRKIIEKWPNMNANFIYTGEGEVMLKPGDLLLRIWSMGLSRKYSTQRSLSHALNWWTKGSKY